MATTPVTRHEGEYSVQERIYGSDTARTFSRAVGTGLPPGAFSFIENLSMAIIGSRDASGNVWASVLFGEPGFLHAVDVNTLNINATLAAWSPHDPLQANLAEHSAVGILLIDFASRRRLRVNGKMVRSTSDPHWSVHVEQAYANCPRYIQRRLSRPFSARPLTPTVSRGSHFSAAQMQSMGRVDTFFVASAHPQHGVDASHRGGSPGFVNVLTDASLHIPDYAGNNMFNTLGNIFTQPRVGLTFLDFDNQCILQCTGNAEILWHLDEPMVNTGGTQRYWRFDLESWIQFAIPCETRWDFVDYSPFNPTHSAAIR